MQNNLNSKDFKIWVCEISKKYKQAQIKAAVSVNTEMLKLYFELGKEISHNSFKSAYGTSFYDSLSNELIKQIPNVTGLSPRNLRYTESFYNLYLKE